MDITRRGFIGMLGAAVAKPTYFFAPIGGWKSDVIINPNDLRTEPHPIYWNKHGVWHGRYNSIALLDGIEQMPVIHPRTKWRTPMSEITFRLV